MCTLIFNIYSITAHLRNNLYITHPLKVYSSGQGRRSVVAHRRPWVHHKAHKCSSVILVCLQSCAVSPYSTPPRRKLYTCQQSLPIYPQPLPYCNILLPTSVNLFIVEISCKRNHTICGLLSLVSFIQYRNFEVYSSGSIYQYFISSHEWIIFHCSDWISLIWKSRMFHNMKLWVPAWLYKVNSTPDLMWQVMVKM